MHGLLSTMKLHFRPLRCFTIARKANTMSESSAQFLETIGSGTQSYESGRQVSALWSEFYTVEVLVRLGNLNEEVMLPT